MMGNYGLRRYEHHLGKRFLTGLISMEKRLHEISQHLLLGGLITIKKRLEPNADWNTLVENGMYYTSGYNTSYTNTPSGAHLYGILLVFSPIPNAILQMYMPDGDNPRIYVRVHNNDWTTWREHKGVNI